MRSRIVDVSRAAAETLGFKDKGIAEVRIETLASAVAVARVKQAAEAEMDLTK